ncbi:MAG: family 20 glycosylhydrolase, partial [Eubacterium sp.]|nr:family 20 glycosylhydrolase [Eubacterium sp.]
MKKIKAPDIKLSITGDSVQFTADKSWNIEFIGADFTQLVDDDLKVHTPLKDTSATLSFRCKKGSEVIEKDCTLQIKGAYGAPVKKPNVIPEPAQWHPTGGMLRDISSYSYDESLKSAADLFADDFLKVTGKAIEKADNGTVCFSVDEGLAYLGDEGYEIECEGNSMMVKVSALIGAIWAGKTICQLMVQGGFPHGIMRDYPRYSVRGFMLDVGRRPVSLAMLERIVDSMAWYKMNDFQVHLSDNYIWLEDYAQNGDESTFDAYSAFRLESSLKNDKGETPTSEDYSYSKAEFNSFMRASLNKGVRITPEIDMPAHALAFTKVFPEYAVMGEV